MILKFSLHLNLIQNTNPHFTLKSPINLTRAPILIAVAAAQLYRGPPVSCDPFICIIYRVPTEHRNTAIMDENTYPENERGLPL